MAETKPKSVHSPLPSNPAVETALEVAVDVLAMSPNPSLKLGAEGLGLYIAVDDAIEQVDTAWKEPTGINVGVALLAVLGVYSSVGVAPVDVPVDLLKGELKAIRAVSDLAGKPLIPSHTTGPLIGLPPKQVDAGAAPLSLGSGRSSGPTNYGSGSSRGRSADVNSAADVGPLDHTPWRRGNPEYKAPMLDGRRLTVKELNAARDAFDALGGDEFYGAGSFDSAAESLAYHFAKHGWEFGNTTNVTAYLKTQNKSPATSNPERQRPWERPTSIQTVRCAAYFTTLVETQSESALKAWFFNSIR